MQPRRWILEGRAVFNPAVNVAVTAILGMLVLASVVAIARGHRRAATAGHPQPVARPGVGTLPRGCYVPAATDLVSDFEVSRAIGVCVEARGGPAEADYHPLRGGDPLLQVRVLAGRAARAAMRVHRRRGRPLSHAGDEAFSGDGWVLGRRRDIVVMLRQFDPGRWRVIGGLPWLLSTALNRVPVPEADLYG
jgi:hypothetical protein